MKQNKQSRRFRIKKGIRKKIFGTAEMPRLSVFRSNTEIYGQIIDDTAGHTLAAAASIQKDVEVGNINKTEAAKVVGKELAQKAKDAGIQSVVFDRNGYLYHGRVKAFAEGAREGGLNF